MYNLSAAHAVPLEAAVLLSVNYAAMVALIGYFTVDLVFAEGLIRKKIRSIGLCSVYLFLLILANLILPPLAGSPPAENLIGRILIVETCITAFFTLTILTADLAAKPPADHTFNRGNTLPEKYLRPRRILTILETVFRLFPYPEPVGLYKIGGAGAGSPVYVTGNYELTVRRVSQALRGQDCWLLVCNSRGVNVWCASLAGHFGTRDIVDAIRLTGLPEKVSHRRILLPQLCAPNVSRKELKEMTGFESDFGPLSIKNIGIYTRDPFSPGIRLATFSLRERLEMSVSSPLILTIVLIFGYNFVDLWGLLVVLPLVYLLSMLHSIVFPYRPIKNIVAWSVASGVGAFILLYAFSRYFGDLLPIGTILAVALGFCYLINEFAGWSPLIKYNFLPSKTPEISVDASKCIGCRTCIKVCPKGVYVFKDKKAKVMDAGACELCKACYRQCPTSAIYHSQEKRPR